MNEGIISGQWTVDSDWFWGIYYTEVVCFSYESYYTERHGGFTEWHGVVYIFLSVSSCLLRALRVRNISQRYTESPQSYTEDLMPRRGYIIIEKTYQFVC